MADYIIAPVEERTERAILQKARDLIAGEDPKITWGQGAWIERVRGDSDDCTVCCLGAVDAATVGAEFDARGIAILCDRGDPDDEEHQLWNSVYGILGQVLAEESRMQYNSVMLWNDTPGRKQEEVLSLLDKALEALNA